MGVIWDPNHSFVGRCSVAAQKLKIRVCCETSKMISLESFKSLTVKKEAKEVDKLQSRPTTFFQPLKADSREVMTLSSAPPSHPPSPSSWLVASSAVSGAAIAAAAMHFAARGEASHLQQRLLLLEENL